MRKLLGTSALAAVLALGGVGMANAQTQNQTTPNTTAGSTTAGANVHVKEPAPNVMVKEPQPQVTVQQPKPDVVVKQPQPNVAVQQPQPQVTVQQPKPQVTVQEPKPNVTVHEAKPDVTVQRQGAPSVDVNRTGQTNVKVVPENQQQQATQGATQQKTAQEQQPANQGVPLVAAKNLIGKQVKTNNGNNVGEVQNLLIGPAGKVQALVVKSGGGVFGIGSNENVVPVKDVQIANNEAKVNFDQNQLQKMPSFDKNNISQYGTGWRAYR